VAVFSLVHGGQHGAWCWTFVIAELRRRGHDAVAVDLPIGDVDAGAARYAEVVAESLRDAGDEVIAVGHSLGGLTIPVLPGLRPVRRLVFVSAGLPEIGRRYFESLADEGDSAIGPLTRGHLADAGPTVHQTPTELARATFYSDVSPELQDWAIPQLRPQSRTPHREITPLTAWPATPRTLIHAEDDRAIPLALARRRARRILDQELVVIPGGHSPFLSRPGELAELLAQLALC
jgi:pimeloyl-ACP methyl ester carboxylesterase